MNLFNRKPKVYTDAEFDMSIVRVFAIERRKEETVIGYIAGNQEGLWYIKCSPQKHDEMVQRFRKEMNRINEAHGRSPVAA